MDHDVSALRRAAAGAVLLGTVLGYSIAARAGDAPAVSTPATTGTPASAAPAKAPAAASVASGPILVFQLASSQADVLAAQRLTKLLAERLRFVYGDDVRMVTDLGSETVPAVAHRLNARLYFGGSVQKVNDTYFTDVQSRDGVTGAIVAEQRFQITALDALPKDFAIVAMADPGPMLPNAHYVLVPLIADNAPAAEAKSDTFIKLTQDDLVKDLQVKGITTTVVPAMDPIDVRMSAPDLCRDNNATAVIVGHTWYKQDYKQGALKGGAKGLEKALEIVPVAGPIVAGVVNATTNAVAGAGASDDQYIAHAEVDVTLLSCEGKRMWSGSGIGDNTHYSNRNVTEGQVGAITIATTNIVDLMTQHR